MKAIFRLFMAAHVFLYRLTGGKIGGRISSAPVLLLTTVGRKSGQARTIPLGYFLYEGEPLLAASNAGQDSNPGWYYNLKANPQVTVEIDGDKFTARAEQVDAAAYAQAWAEVIRQSPPYATYATRTQRQIPLFRLRHV